MTDFPDAPAAGGPGAGPDTSEETAAGGDASAAAKRRRRGSRGGRGRSQRRAGGEVAPSDDPPAAEPGGEQDPAAGADLLARPQRAARPARPKRAPAPEVSEQPELPDPPLEGKVRDAAVADQVLVRRPRIGDSRPAPPVARPAPEPEVAPSPRSKDRSAGSKPSRRGNAALRAASAAPAAPAARSGRAPRRVEVEPPKPKERNGRPVGRYLMCVHSRPELTQIAVLAGRSLIEHYVSRAADDVSQIHGNIYVGRVQNVLPGMEAAFIDIGTPKNAVLYRGDVQYDAEDIVEGGKGGGKNLRIEQVLKGRQLIICQVTKNPIGAKGARLTQEVSLPGRFVVLIPNSRTYGISKRLPDDERRRLRALLDKVKPAEHGVIVRTAAQAAPEDELRRDVERLLEQWNRIEAAARGASGPTLLYKEPDMAVRVIREEFNDEYRGVVIDDRALFEEVHGYVASISPSLADRVEFYDAPAEGLPLFENHHIHEQLHKALDRKVWLPSGGSLIIEHTEALTVIDVNTGKNVGSTNLEETVYRNNLEAAEEIAKQLRLRDIGGIIVIDFIDMELKENRQAVVARFRQELARDKTRTQVFDISELGLVEMTRKRIGEGLLTEFADPCPHCEGRGVVVDHSLIAGS
ncbi:MAG: Rne/Rng family ribonuclease [Acidimicrobiales bacterium]